MGCTLHGLFNAKTKLFYLFGFVFCFAQPAGAQEASVQQKGYYTSDFVIDGIPRNIAFYIPAGYAKASACPVVFALHDEGQNGKAMIKKYGDYFEKLADSAVAIVVYPDAVKGHWNTKMGAGAAADTINDAGFANIMIDYFAEQYKADAQRMYAIGFNSGGQMAWRLGCDVPKKLAAIAPFIPSVAEAQKNCTQTIAFFNAETYMQQPTKKQTYSAISDAFNFLLQQQKK